MIIAKITDLSGRTYKFKLVNVDNVYYWKLHACDDNIPSIHINRKDFFKTTLVKPRYGAVYPYHYLCDIQPFDKEELLENSI